MLPCHRNERSRAIALRLCKLIALLSSSRTVRGNFQGRKCRIYNRQKLRDESPELARDGSSATQNSGATRLEGKITRKEHGQGWQRPLILPVFGFP